MKKIHLILMSIGLVIILSACSTGSERKEKKQEVIEETKEEVTTKKDTEAYIYGNSLGIFPIERTTDGIILDKQETVFVEGVAFEVEFYRNLSYDAGLEGKYTFLVINPLNNPDEEAPLWVYLHGGAAGYFSEDGGYEANRSQDETTWNKEETYNAMLNGLSARLYTKGELRDNTLVRRLKEGYRMLVVSYSDHDTYLGTGTEYPNNPNGGEVNGLQASMSAVDYVTENYPTNNVFAHGSSAGAFGAYGLGVAYYMEGTSLTGIIADSGIPVHEVMTLWDYYAGHPDDWFTENWDSETMSDKIGPFGDSDNELLAEDMIYRGFDVPILGISGKEDHWFRAYLPVMDVATLNGFDTNAEWVYSNLIKAIEKQENSPHELLLLDNTGHVPTITNHPIASDAVDEFITKAKEYNLEQASGEGASNHNISTSDDTNLEFTMETYVYKESFGQQIELDFYRPVESDYDELPVLVFYHGGGYKGGTKGDAARMFDEDVRGEIRKEYLRNGYAVVSCNYIVTDEDMGIDIEDCWIDGKDSIRWLRKNAEMLGIDAENIGVMGSSAGGGMATMLGYTEDDQFIGDDDLSEYSSSVNYVINMWGAAHYNVEPFDYRVLETLDGIDAEEIAKMNHDLYRIGVSEEDDWKTIQDRSIELTPTTYLDDGDVPTISFYGEDDVTTHASQGVFLHGELDEMGIENQLYIYEGEGHGLKGLSGDVIESAMIEAFEFGHNQYN